MTAGTLRDPSADTLRPIAHVGRVPLHVFLVPFPLTCFIGTLLTDIAYWRTAEMMWANFSAWLVSAGVVLAILAAIVGLFDFFGNRLDRSRGPAWSHVLGNLAALVLAVINMMVHTHDAWTSVVPWGLTLSALVVLILLFTVWMGWALVHRRSIGAV